MANIIDLTGKTFGRLTVLKRATNKKEQPRWKCLCTCGNFTTVYGGHLRSKTTQSCGCLAIELSKQRIKHGMEKTPEYKSWSGMKQRCFNKSDDHFKYYGARGISVCAKWIDSFEEFFQDMGKKPSKTHTLDRIDNDGNYCPENCRWATPTQQGNNKRDNTNVTIDGITKSIAVWSRISGIKDATIRSRIFRSGWPHKLAIFGKPNKHGQRPPLI